MAYKIAVIGSFRKHYKEVCETLDTFRKMEIGVTSPKGTAICGSIKAFVIFESDNSEYTPEEIQMITLEKILSADVVYVCNPRGYVGRTTCYEIGFCYSRNKPLYFLCSPKDLPMPVVDEQIVSPEEMGQIILNGKKRIFEPGMCQTALDSYHNIFSSVTGDEKLEKGVKKLVICGSMEFFPEMMDCQTLLKRHDIRAIIPKEEGTITEAYTDVAFREFKRKVSRAYLKKIREKDTEAVLIYNGEKHGQQNYIGANTLVEIAMAFTWNRKIYLYNDIYEPLQDELLAWGCICLKGNMERLIDGLKATCEEKDKEYRQLSMFEDFTNL